MTAFINYDAFRAIYSALKSEHSATADYVLADLKALSIWGNTIGIPANWSDKIEISDRLIAAVIEAVFVAADREAIGHTSGTDTATNARKILAGS